MESQIRYAQTADGVSIAYVVVGKGPPLLFARPLLSIGVADELEWPTGFWPSLTDVRSVVLWDLRGEGLSGSAPEPGFDDWVADMEAVANVAAAARFDLVGMLKQCHVAMAYAARRPDRVDHLALYVPLVPGSGAPLIPPWPLPLAMENWHEFVDIYAFRFFGWGRGELGQRWAEGIRARYTAAQFLHRVDVIDAIEEPGMPRSSQRRRLSWTIAT